MVGVGLAWRLGLAEAAFSMVTIAQGPSSRWSAIARTTTLRRTGETSRMAAAAFSNKLRDMVLPDLRPDEGQHLAEGCQLVRGQIEKAPVGTRSRVETYRLRPPLLQVEKPSNCGMV